MSFLQPAYLFGLLALAIPVIIHLINFRKPKAVNFSTLAFFQEIQRSTIRRIKIKEWLLLAVRLLALLLIALALARPFLPSFEGSTASSNEPRVIGILVDNSPSMRQIDEEGPYFEQAKSLARHIIEQANSKDRFIIQKSAGEELGAGTMEKPRALEVINQLTSENKGDYTMERLQLLNQSLEASVQRNKTIYWITDAQRSQLKQLERQTGGNEESDKLFSTPVQFVKVGKSLRKNVAVTDLRLKEQILSQDKPLTLEAEVTNFGEAQVSNQYLSLNHNGELSGQYQLQLKAGESSLYSFEITPENSGDSMGKLLIEGDDMAFDNSFHYVIRVPEKRRVLVVENATKDSPGEFGSYLRPALEAARQTSAQITFETVPSTKIQETDLAQYDAAILNGLPELPSYLREEMQRWVQEGHGIVFIPSEQGSINDYNRFFESFNGGNIQGVRGEFGSFNAVTQLGPIEISHPVIEDLFQLSESGERVTVNRPQIYYYYRYKQQLQSGDYVLLSTETGDPLVVEQPFGDGKVMISMIGTEPGWSNFPVKALFAPLYYRIALYTASSESGGLVQHTLGKTLTMKGDFSQSDVIMEINDEQLKPETHTIADGIEVTYPGKEWEPGKLVISDGRNKRAVAVNQNIMESDFTTFSSQEVDNYLDNYLTVNTILHSEDGRSQQVLSNISSAGFGKEIWDWFLWAGLVLLLLETVISRMFKAEFIS